MFTKVNHFILHGILIAMPCVLAGNDSADTAKDPGQVAAQTRANYMNKERLRLAKRNHFGQGKNAEKNPLDDYGSTMTFLSGGDLRLADFSVAIPAVMVGGIVDGLKAPIVAIRDKKAKLEAQKLHYNLTLLSELNPEVQNKKNIENLHKYYTEKKDFKDLTMALLIRCMAVRARLPLPDDDKGEIDAIDYKDDSFKRMLLDAIREKS